MARDAPLTLYVEQETKDQLHREADDRGLSLSAYCHQLLDQARKEDAQEELAEELNAEQRLREIATTATEELQQTAADIRDMNAKLGVYAVANWELLKQEHPDSLRQEALRTGRRRLRTPLGDHSVDVDPDPTTDTPDSNAGRDTDESTTGDDNVFDRLE
ncbi:hypothetical protein [Halomarina pelagica]|uniref:hypothetical protein n=1 Tax=Halomarina pelagica TaxID=2961599 RepID=UPI0020C518F3|nr:hypothetical protein [Halomarina sp. BND7]